MKIITKKGMSYTMVRFRKPGHKGETWYVSVHGCGGGPYTKDGYDSSIPARFTSSVTQRVTGRYHVYTLAEFEKTARVSRNHEHPEHVYKILFKKAVDFCKKHGYVNVDPRWKKGAHHRTIAKRYAE
jgi:hypothetical protein